MKFDTENVLYIIIDTITAIFAVVGNSFVCYAILKSSKLKKKPMYLFVTSLAFADITVGAIAIPFGILTKLGLPYNSPYLCANMLTFIIIPTQISIFNLMTVSIERYLAIRHPQFHFTKLNRKRSLVVIAITWVASTIIGFLSLAWSINLPSFYSFDDSHKNVNLTTPFNSKNASSIVTSTTPVLCEFRVFVDDDYMLFNFLLCVLVPLLICAGLYLLIYISLLRENRVKKWSTPIKDAQKFDSLHHRCSYSCSTNSVEYKSSKLSSNYNLCAVCQMCCAIPKQEEKDSEHTEDNFIKDEFNLQTSKCHDNCCSKIGFQDKLTKQNKKKFTSSPRPTEEPTPTKNENESRDETKQQKRQQKIKREIRAAAVLGIIVLSFAICWMPLHILNTVHRFSPGMSEKIPSWVLTLAILLSHANSAINIFLYSWRLKTFRAILKWYICFGKRRNR